MTLRTVLEFTSDDDDDLVIEQIADVLNRRMPSAMKQNAWLKLIVRNLSESDLYVVNKGDEDQDAINERSLVGRWDQAFEILCDHVGKAVEEIKQL